MALKSTIFGFSAICPLSNNGAEINYYQISVSRPLSYGERE